jgi:hypothetical protein
MEPCVVLAIDLKFHRSSRCQPRRGEPRYEYDATEDEADGGRRLREEHEDRDRRDEGGRLEAQSASPHGPAGLAANATIIGFRLDVARRLDCNAGHAAPPRTWTNVVLRKSDVAARHAGLGVDALHPAV